LNSATQSVGSKKHLVKATPETVHWGNWDPAFKPVLHVESGDVVTLENVTCNPEWMPPKDSGFTILPEHLEIHQKGKRGTGKHFLTGPIYVNGAAIGDVLEVNILDIKIRQDWAWNAMRGYAGTIPEDFPYLRVIHMPLDLKANVAIMPSGIKVPLRPFFGQLGVAPGKAFGRQDSKEPREYGGNLDCKDLVAGTTIYLPVWNEGALFSAGDGHGAQGHGEVNGTAIETALEGTFKLTVRKDLGWKIPRAETPTHYIAFGLDADMDDAAKQALREMIKWIVAIRGIAADEAYALCSFACDLHVTQSVNGVKGVHAMLAKSLLER